MECLINLAKNNKMVVEAAEERARISRSRSPAVREDAVLKRVQKIGPTSFKKAQARSQSSSQGSPHGSKQRSNVLEGGIVGDSDDEEFAEYLRSWDKAAARGGSRDGSTTRSEVSDCSIMENEEGELVHGPESRKRGRPVTTREYEAKKRNWTEKQRREEEKRIRDLSDPLVPAALSKSRKEKEHKLFEELKHCPTEDLARRIVEQVATVDKVNTTSKTLRGVDQGSLNKAAATISAAAAHLIGRMQTGEDPVAKDVEIEDLRRKTARLEEEVAELRKRLEERQGVPWGEEMMEVDAVSTTPPSRSRKKKRTKVLREDSSEEEEVTCRREEILREIEETGMPAAVRPSLQGGPPAIIDPAVPPKRTQTAEDSLEERLKAEMGRMERRMEEMLRGVMERISMPPPPPPPLANRAPSNQKEGGRGRSGNRSQKRGGDPNKDGAAKEAPGKGSAAEKGRKSRTPSGARKQPEKPAQEAWTEVVKRGRKPQQTEDRSATGLTRSGQAMRPAQAQAQGGRQQQQQQQQKRAPMKKGAGGKAAPAHNKRGKAAPAGGNRSVEAEKGKVGARKPPKTAAVVLTCLGGDYDLLMKEARSKIALKDLGIEGPLKPKRAQTGALLIEFPGKERGGGKRTGSRTG